MIRPYLPADSAAVLHLLELNTPDFFHPDEAEELKEYLAEEREDYFVMELDEKIVGAGGLNFFKEEKLVRISWDMIHPDYQGRGLGRALLDHRIAEIKKLDWVEKIVVRTAQDVFGFYAKAGFEEVQRKKDFWAPGFDLVELWMVMKK